MAEGKIVERIVSQRCIGYQRSPSASVIESEVLFTDGTQGTRWQVYNNENGQGTSLLEECPRIDIPETGATAK